MGRAAVFWRQRPTPQPATRYGRDHDGEAGGGSAGRAAVNHQVQADRRPSGAERLAALVALAAPVALVGVVIAMYVRNFAAVVVAVALVVVVAVTLWFALTRRGAPRAIGAVAAAAAIAGEIALIATHWRGLLAVLALIVLLAAYGLAARFAVGRAALPDTSHGADGPPGPAARRPVLIINLKSGGGKAARFDLAAAAQQRGIEVVVLQPGDDLRGLAQAAVARGADVIGMAGGDGSQALVATVAMESDVAHVCIPAGTRNHFALDLGLDRDDVVGALDAFTDGVERRIDLARANDRVFVNNASLGVYAKVVQSDAYRDAKLHTWTDLLPGFLGPDAPPIGLAFTGPDEVEHRDASLVLVSNNPYVLTHLAGAGTRARIDTGTLGIVAARVRSSADVAQLVALETTGQAARFAGLTQWSGPEFEVRSDAPVEVGLDGEALILDAPVRFVSLPAALRVRTVRGADTSPAARAVQLTPASLHMLVRIAAGRAAEA